MKTVDSPQFPITAFDNVKVNNKKCEYNVIYCTLLFPTLLGHVLLTKSLNCGKSTGKKKKMHISFCSGIHERREISLWSQTEECISWIHLFRFK